jgi:hypothetical protein
VCTLEAVVYLLRELGGNCGGNGVTHAAAVRGGCGRGKARLEKAGGAGGAEGGNGEGVCQPVCQAGAEYVCGRVMRMFRVFVDRLARQSGRVGVGGVNVYAGYGSTKIQLMGSLSRSCMRCSGLRRRRRRRRRQRRPASRRGNKLPGPIPAELHQRQLGALSHLWLYKSTRTS